MCVLFILLKQSVNDVQLLEITRFAFVTPRSPATFIIPFINMCTSP